MGFKTLKRVARDFTSKIKHPNNIKVKPFICSFLCPVLLVMPVAGCRSAHGHDRLCIACLRYQRTANPLENPT
jgi:hypothetical protein